MAREFEVISNPQFRNMHVFLVRMLSRTPHMHAELEVGFVLRGSAALRMGGQRYALNVMDGYWINPLEAHEFRAEAQDAIILAIQVSPRLLESFFAETPPVRFRGGPLLRRAIANDAQYGALFALCAALARAYLERPPHYEYDCFALVADLLARLNRLLPGEELTPAAWTPIRRRREHFVSILDYIDKNFRRKLLLQEIAGREGLTMPYLSHLFRDTLGMSFQEYLKKKRFEYARPLIIGTNRSLLDISLESGFSDTRYMTGMFMEEFGCSPRAYRRQSGNAGCVEAASGGTAQHILSREEAARLLREAAEPLGL